MPAPSAIKLHRRTRMLELRFGDEHFELPAEYLRVYSPSAEVRGHGGVGAKLEHGKIDVSIVDLSQVGNYAIKLSFDDGHDTGIYSWDYLHELGRDHEAKWADYLQRLAKAGLRRDPFESTVKFIEPK